MPPWATSRRTCGRWAARSCASRATGRRPPGNPGGSWDPRIWSIGHRNVQGLAWRASDGLGVSTEHGPDRNDEINRLDPGQFGWDPVRPPSTAYDESVPMTDTAKFPDARRPVVPSGPVTNAFCGATFVSGERWEHLGRRPRRHDAQGASPCGRSSSSRRRAGCRTSASR